MADESSGAREEVEPGLDDEHVGEHPAEHETKFFIDKEPFDASSDDLTPRQILTDYAKEDPTQTVLVLVHGKDRTKLTDLDTPIELKNGMRFTLLHQGPTPVS